jgi:hypothetical protein
MGKKIAGAMTAPAMRVQRNERFCWPLLEV